jgi:hypothetical protein
MPAYLVRNAARPREDILIEDDDLALTFAGNWAVFTDAAGVTLAIPAEQGASIQRIDPDDQGQPDDDRPAPEG